jgi:hypothetical protein
VSDVVPAKPLPAREEAEGPAAQVPAGAAVSPMAGWAQCLAAWPSAQEASAPAAAPAGAPQEMHDELMQSALEALAPLPEADAELELEFEVPGRGAVQVQMKHEGPLVQVRLGSADALLHQDLQRQCARLQALLRAQWGRPVSCSVSRPRRSGDDPEGGADDGGR